jgi:hypothetical protein
MNINLGKNMKVNKDAEAIMWQLQYSENKTPEEVDKLMKKLMDELYQIDEDNIFGIVNPNTVNPDIINSDVYRRDTANIDLEKISQV